MLAINVEMLLSFKDTETMAITSESHEITSKIADFMLSMKKLILARHPDKKAVFPSIDNPR